MIQLKAALHGSTGTRPLSPDLANKSITQRRTTIGLWITSGEGIHLKTSNLIRTSFLAMAGMTHGIQEASHKISPTLKESK